jgi:hypothetical protein
MVVRMWKGREFLFTFSEKAAWQRCVEVCLAVSDKLDTHSTDPTSALQVINSKELKTLSLHKNLHVNVYRTLAQNHPNWKQPSCP